LGKFCLAFALVFGASVASAAPIIDGTWAATIAPVNGSGIAGTAVFTFTATTIDMHLVATGLEPGDHPAHLHGIVSGGMLLPPGTPVDTDGDGYIETPEAEAAAGPPVVNLGIFTVGPSGVLNVTQTYNQDTTALVPREFLTFEMHGMTVPEGAGAGTPHEVNGTGGYKVILPIGGGPLAAVPEPSTYALCAGALTLLAALRRRVRA
jgi:PEP-CTERM motif